MWVCLKMLCTPLYPMVLLIIIPFLNGYFIGNIPNIFRQTHVFFWFYAQEKIYAARKPVMPLASKQDRLEVHQAHHFPSFRAKHRNRALSIGWYPQFMDSFFMFFCILMGKTRINHWSIIWIGVLNFDVEQFMSQPFPCRSWPLVFMIVLWSPWGPNAMSCAVAQPTSCEWHDCLKLEAIVVVHAGSYINDGIWVYQNFIAVIKLYMIHWYQLHIVDISMGNPRILFFLLGQGCTVGGEGLPGDCFQSFCLQLDGMQSVRLSFAFHEFHSMILLALHLIDLIHLTWQSIWHSPAQRSNAARPRGLVWLLCRVEGQRVTRRPLEIMEEVYI